MTMTMKRVLVGLGLCAAIALGAAQLATPVKADPPIDNCAAVLCLPCPPGSVAKPTPGNCCLCVPAH
jgi:hypothetical protein